MNKIKTRLLFWLALPALVLSSCYGEDDVDEGGNPVTNKEVDVRVSIQMPASSAPTTYAITEIDENSVETIDVLAFKIDVSKPSGWAFDYNAEGTSITDATTNDVRKSKKQFAVKLNKSPDEQTFVILANVRSEVQILDLANAEGTDKDALLAQLVYSQTGAWNANNNLPDNDPSKTFNAFPMWGEVKKILTGSVAAINDVNLVRAIARFDVVLDQTVITAGNFTLNTIYIYNSKNKGRIVPDPANLENNAKVKAATEPTGSINNDSPIIYTVPTSMNTAFERTMYLFEAKGKAENQSSQATCVVVGGIYGTDPKPTYYRLDFLKKIPTDTYYRDILRNHKYKMNITNVFGSGYGTPEEAFAAKPFNMVAEVVYWDDGAGGNVVFDGQYYLSVMPETVFNFSKEADTDVVRIKTDIPTGFKITKITEADGTTVNNGWLKTDKTTGTLYGTGEVETSVSIIVTNNTGAARTGHIFIQADRLTAKLTVTQNTKSKNSAVFTFIEYTNVNGTGLNIPVTGGRITAKVNTNMGWTLRTSISGVESTMAEPASETPANYTLSVTLPRNDSWTQKIKVWIEYKGVALQETTYTQAAGYPSYGWSH